MFLELLCFLLDQLFIPSGIMKFVADSVIAFAIAQRGSIKTKAAFKFLWNGGHDPSGRTRASLL